MRCSRSAMQCRQGAVVTSGMGEGAGTRRGVGLLEYRRLLDRDVGWIEVANIRLSEGGN